MERCSVPEADSRSALPDIGSVAMEKCLLTGSSVLFLTAV